LQGAVIPSFCWGFAVGQGRVCSEAWWNTLEGLNEEVQDCHRKSRHVHHDPLSEPSRLCDTRHTISSGRCCTFELDGVTLCKGVRSWQIMSVKRAVPNFEQSSVGLIMVYLCSFYNSAVHLSRCSEMRLSTNIPCTRVQSPDPRPMPTPFRFRHVIVWYSVVMP
jgi:hypothetical protein